MAKDTFGNVPNSTGGIRGISRQIAAVLALNRRDGTKNGLTYGQHSALENQKHIQNIQGNVVSSVLAGQAADKAHRSTLAQNRQKHKLGLADRADAVSAATSNVPEGYDMTGISFPGGNEIFLVRDASFLGGNETFPVHNAVILPVKELDHACKKNK